VSDKYRRKQKLRSDLRAEVTKVCQYITGLVAYVDPAGAVFHFTLN